MPIMINSPSLAS